MTRNLQNELDQLNKKLLSLSSLVESSVEKAVRSVSKRDTELAKEVVAKDDMIDLSEVKVEQESVKILALYQPVATDLRFVLAVLKINNDLERIGDLAVHIAERSLFLAKEAPIEMPFDFGTMEQKTRLMLKKALNSLIQMDLKAAKEVFAEDDKVDAINKKMYGQVTEGIRTSPNDTNLLIHCLSISRYLERIADYATNIAEEVVYLIEGNIVRHHPLDP